MAAAALGMAAAACGPQHLRAEVSQPNPLSQPTETLRTSETAVIVTGDMDLEVPRMTGNGGPARSLYVMDRYPLRNAASFTVVSRDRLRFHVQIEHKWKDFTELEGWRAELIDGDGRVFHPVSVESALPRHITEVWDYETVTAHRDGYGNLVRAGNDGHLDRHTLGSLSLFRGGGDYVFYSREIFTPATERVTLRLHRKGTTYEFTWRMRGEAVALR